MENRVTLLWLATVKGGIYSYFAISPTFSQLMTLEYILHINLLKPQPAYLKGKSSDGSQTVANAYWITTVYTEHWPAGSHNARLGTPYNSQCRNCKEKEKKPLDNSFTPAHNYLKTSIVAGWGLLSFVNGKDLLFRSKQPEFSSACFSQSSVRSLRHQNTSNWVYRRGH